MDTISVSKNSLRFSFFKLKPGAQTEKNLIDQFEERLEYAYDCSTQDEGQDKNFVAYKFLGQWDCLLAYEVKEREHKILKKGTIPGVTHFDNIDCIAVGDNSPQLVIQKAHAHSCVSLILIKISQESLQKEGAFFLRDKYNCLYNFSSESCVVVLFDGDLNSLIAKTKKALSYLSRYADHIVPVYGIKLEKKDDSYELNPTAINCRIPNSVKVEWIVEALRPNSSVSSFKKQFSDIFYNKTGKKPICFGGGAPSQLRYMFESGFKWGDVFLSIREVRSNCSKFLHGTNVDIYFKQSWAHKGKRTVNEQFWDIGLSEEECNKILNNLGDRVGSNVIKSLLTLADALEDCRNYSAVYQLLDAAHWLKDHATLDAREGQCRDWQENCLTAAIDLMDAVRQRISSIPVLANSKKPAFEVPPPSLRLYYESVEQVAFSLLEQLNKIKLDDIFREIRIKSNEIRCILTSEQVESFNRPYLMIDTSDGASFAPSRIRYPEHQLLDPFSMVSLTHETLHSFTHNFRSYFKYIADCNESVVPFVADDKIDFIKILDEYCVEILDFIFSYRFNLSWFLMDEWIHYQGYFDELIRNENAVEAPAQIEKYLRRLCVVALWFGCFFYDENVKYVEQVEQLDFINGFEVRLGDRAPKSQLSKWVDSPNQLRKLVRGVLTYLRKVTSHKAAYYAKQSRLDKPFLDSDFMEEIISHSNYIDLTSRFFKPELPSRIQNHFKSVAPCLQQIFDFVNRLVANEQASEVITCITDYSSKEHAKSIVQGKIVTERINYPHILVNSIAETIRLRHIDNLEQSHNTDLISKTLVLTLWHSATRYKGD